MKNKKAILELWKKIWRLVILLGVPILTLPIALLGTQASLCGWVVIVMAFYWMSEAIPLPVTSLIPVFAFPLLGILSTEDICSPYLNKTVMMFMGGLMVAVSFEHSDLHRRIALNILIRVGTTVRWLMLGFMLTSAFLSMWISNTAVTAMMIPILDALIVELHKQDKATPDEIESINLAAIDKANPRESIEEEELQEDIGLGINLKSLRVGFLLCIAYSATIGGTGCLPGTGPNLILSGILSDAYGNKSGINFLTWMLYNIPGMLLNLLMAWIWLQFVYLGLRGGKTTEETRERIGKMIRKKLADMGPITSHQLGVFICFVIVVLLWLFREPHFIKGWANFMKAVKVDDATAVMLVIFFMFCIPKQMSLRRCSKGEFKISSEGLLTWKVLHEKMPWGIVLLLGGGFALAKGLKTSGLTEWLGDQMTRFRSIPVVGLIILICIMTALLTEITSNTAISVMLLPVLKDLSEALHFHPLLLMLPATISCSFAFMFPVATPPNAIIYGTGHITIWEMVKPGIMMNILCIASTTLIINTYGNWMFGLHTFPEWAAINSTSSS